MRSLFLLMFLLFVSFMADPITSKSVAMNYSKTSNDQDPTPLDFIKLSQDDDFDNLKSMDIAYYKINTLEYLQQLFSVATNETLNNFEEKALDFIMSSFSNGSWANWKGSRPSMESTFQALISLNHTSNMNLITQSQAIEIINFLNSLKRPNGGFFPLQNWDVPDVSSTYRALVLERILKRHFPNLPIELNKTGVVDFVRSTYNEPVFITGASAYGEIQGGKPEILASLFSLYVHIFMNQTDPHVSNVIALINSFTSPNGGVAGYSGSLVQTGYTARAIEYYLLVKSYYPDLLPLFNENFLENAANYITSNQLSNSGFGSSETDRSVSISSTFFAMRIAFLTRNEINLNIDPVGVLTYLLTPNQPTFGIGDFPGNVPSVVETARGILTGKLLGNLDWLHPKTIDYITDTFSEKEGGFGFRPQSNPRIKYTYYGILALRALGKTISNPKDIVNFILQSEVDTGGFGQIPGAHFSYLTHTYWALKSLNLLGHFYPIKFNKTKLIEWLKGLENPKTGMYRNSQTGEDSIISTFRAVEILKLFDVAINSSKILNSVQSYAVPTGGFVNKLSKTVPTMEATYFAFQLIHSLNGSISSLSVFKKFVESLKNADGGYGSRLGFSSRVTATFYAISLLNRLNSSDNAFNFGEGLDKDLFAPLIIQSFVPSINNYQQFSGSYITEASIQDPETHVDQAWVEATWTDGQINKTFTFIGYQTNNSLWRFTIGSFKDEGIIQFQIVANDTNGNIGKTDFFYLKVKSIATGSQYVQINLIQFLIRTFIPFLMLAVAFADLIYSIKKQYSKEVIKKMYKPSKQSEWTDLEIFNGFLLIITMIVIAEIARLVLKDTQFILQNSLFLFRFLLAILLVLFAKYSLGVHTYGLFAPSVLVISMIQIGPFWGTILFFNIFTLLYLVRILIEPYAFPVGFRIGIMMVFNISFLGLLEMIGEVYRIPFLSTAIFVPIIILPWITDRYVSNVIQNDHLFAFSRLLFTLAITWGSYFLMSNDTVVTFVTLNPEIWILLVGIIVYYGRGRRYTILDKRRFRKLFSKKEDPLNIIVRNQNYIAKYNPPEIFPLMNKFDMKLQFEKWNVPTPTIYAVISEIKDIRPTLNSLVSNPRYSNGFVVKPTQSLGGMGIIVITKVLPDRSLQIGNDLYDYTAIEKEMTKIIQGEYLSTQTSSENDIILIEERIVLNEFFKRISVGLPDIRVIVFNGIPVMAMTRLPTSESDGKANLKQGAIGAGIDMETGEIFHAEWKQHEVKIHPDTKQPILGIKIPQWKEVLAIASLAQRSSGLGYAGVDLVMGTVGNQSKIFVLEINKRPGLEIQNINQSSLLNRLDFIEKQKMNFTNRSPLASANMAIKLGKVWKKQNWEKSFKEEMT